MPPDQPTHRAQSSRRRRRTTPSPPSGAQCLPRTEARASTRPHLAAANRTLCLPPVYREQPNAGVHDDTQQHSTRIRTQTGRTERRQPYTTSLVHPASETACTSSILVGGIPATERDCTQPWAIRHRWSRTHCSFKSARIRLTTVPSGPSPARSPGGDGTAR